MNQNRLRVSLVIPAYNEEYHLRQTLEAVAAQTIKPFEVIVVDNNSTDQTAKIARSFPFVKLLTEKKQGIVYARDTGFNATTGDIIGRIDGDTILTPGWIEKVQTIFTDNSTDAVSGSVHFFDVALSPVLDKADYKVRGWMARHMRVHFLWGANMAIRRSAWEYVRNSVCHDGQFHEDLDLAAHMHIKGQKVVYNPHLRAEVSGRRIDMNIFGLIRYAWINDRTYARHGIGLDVRKYMYPAMLLILFFYLPLRVMYRGYDAQARKFKASELFKNKETNRVDPATFKV
ncbi:MAG TPA: glycosyltransferase family 2 protein [Patescibacteria group bacterium]|nr:glycosyltransferase family 2 protein [Patescibacteria group bacterium]